MAGDSRDLGRDYHTRVMKGISINYPTQARAALPWPITASGIHRASNEHVQRHDWRSFFVVFSFL